MNRHALLGFNGLVQSITPAAALHHPTGELIDDGHFRLAFLVGHDYIVGVQLVDFLGAQGLHQVMGVVVVHIKQVVDPEHLLGVDDAALGEHDVALFFVYIIVAVFVVLIFASLQ